MNIETKLVQAGVSKDQSTGAISMPIYQSATFSHPELGKSTGFDYSRTANPTRKVLEETIASLEEGHAGFAFSSGMAAITTVLLMFKPGDHIVISNDLYGGTYRLLEENFKQYGITTTYTDTSSITSISKEITEQTVAIFIETPLDIALARRIIRDYSCASSKEIIADLKFYLERSRICFEDYKEIAKYADLIIDGSLKVNEIIEIIIENIKN